jgi:sarcosine oxidase subunit gamma
MPDVLAARSALGTPAGEAMRAHGITASEERAHHEEAVRLAEQPSGVTFALRFDEADRDAVDAIATLTGLRLAADARAVTASGRTALWLGPGDWLLRFESAAAPTPEWHQARGVVAIETSDLWFRVRVHGACSRHVLATGCALDLDPARFPSGAAAVTQLARIRALIHHVVAGAYDVHVERSYAAYVWAWLGDAIHEFLPVKERA